MDRIQSIKNKFKEMNIPTLGMRTIKTGIAVFLCVLLGDYLVQNPFFSVTACIISLQDTVKGSLKTGINRVTATMVGGVTGYLLALIHPGGALLCGIGVIITIYMCNLLRFKSVVVACVTFLAIHLGVGTSDPMSYSIHRVLDTSVGVVFGIVVNYALARPDYFNSTIGIFKKIEDVSLRWLKLRIIKKTDADASELKTVIKKLDDVYSKYLDEIDYSLGHQDIEFLEQTIDVCREIYFHMQSICLLQDKLYLSQSNYDRLAVMFKVKKLDWPVDEEESPVFNFHLMKILEEEEYLRILNKSINPE
ncbi:MAG: aromatic acid exporter family protein [Clostridioides sp.]|nr:aromatic acid exporter family protein [Clostridioides sp.]